MWSIAIRSLQNRAGTAMLVVLAIAISVALVLSVEKLRRDARTSFTDTVSGVDLVVGARSGAVQLLLYAVFRIGDATNNISWTSVEDIAARPEVDWLIPLSLGDSHRGFRVLGTTEAYFEHYRYRDDSALEFAAGERFDDVFDTVIGAEVARELGYSVGDPIVVAHGTGRAGLVQHQAYPFRVAGILERTNTPVDATVHVSLEAIEAIHVDWRTGVRRSEDATPAEIIRTMDLSPRAVTALLIGLERRSAVFREQRWINTYREEPLLAVLPGVALAELWNLVSVAETALLVVSAFVVLASLVNLISVLLAGLEARRREMAILRASGARPAQIFLLLTAESTVLSALGVATGFALHQGLVVLGGRWIEQHYGLAVPLAAPMQTDLLLLATIASAGVLVGGIPAWQAYRRSLADGMTPRQ